MPPIREGGDALGNIAAAADFQHVAPEGVGAFLGYNDGWPGLVLGARRSASGPAAAAAGLDCIVASRVLVVGFEVVVAGLVVLGVLAVRGGVCDGVGVGIVAIGGGGVGVVQEFLLSSWS